MLASLKKKKQKEKITLQKKCKKKTKNSLNFYFELKGKNKKKKRKEERIAKQFHIQIVFILLWIRVTLADTLLYHCLLQFSLTFMTRASHTTKQFIRIHIYIEIYRRIYIIYEKF